MPSCGEGSLICQVEDCQNLSLKVFLSLVFPESDAVRAAELNEKANEGLLTDGEREELQVYANVADLLAYWQLKARQALQQNS